MGGCFQATGFPILPLHKTWPSLIFAWPSARDLRDRLFLFIINYRLLRFTIHRDWRDTQIADKSETRSLHASGQSHAFILLYFPPPISPHIHSATRPKANIGYMQTTYRRILERPAPAPAHCNPHLFRTKGLPFAYLPIWHMLSGSALQMHARLPSTSTRKGSTKERPPSETRFSTTCALYCFSPSLRHFRLLKAWGRRVVSDTSSDFFKSLKTEDTNAVPA
jgi:hypothetical protein